MDNGLQEEGQSLVRGIEVSNKEVLQAYLHDGIFRL
jgi:hypothetical protein